MSEVDGITEGEWIVRKAGTYTNGKFELDEYFVARDEDDISIAADICDPDTGKPSLANAILIAAAPKMLEVCYIVLDDLRVTLNQYHLHAVPVPTWIPITIEQLQKVIAAATEVENARI